MNLLSNITLYRIILVPLPDEDDIAMMSWYRHSWRSWAAIGFNGRAARAAVLSRLH